MNNPKPLATLAPTLLARKGGARPAMRAQLNAMTAEVSPTQFEDDLGFNDYGEDEPVHVEAEVVSLREDCAIAQAEVPEVLRQRDVIAAQVADSSPAKDPAATSAPAKASANAPTKQPKSIAKPALSRGRTTAFTLRLDAQRHLQLRMACTLANRSAQQLITDALDQMISGLPDVAMLAAQAAKHR